jgi:hypothetical protein
LWFFAAAAPGHGTGWKDGRTYYWLAGEFNAFAPSVARWAAADCSNTGTRDLDEAQFGHDLDELLDL